MLRCDNPGWGDFIQIMAKREAAMQKDKDEAMKEDALVKAAQDNIGPRWSGEKL